MEVKIIQILGITILLLRQFLIPVLLLYWLTRKSRSRVNLIFKLLTAWTFFIYIFFAGQWSFLPYILRYVFPLLLIALSLKQLLRIKHIVVLDQKKFSGWTKITLQFLWILWFGNNCIEVIRGFRTPEPGIRVSFPLKEGFVAHGGSSTIINYHHADSTAQQYALDISRLNTWGLRASGFFPENLDKYAIYRDTVFSPCDGIIVKTQDGLDNVPPGAEVKANPAGNHIVVQYKNSLIVMAHLQKHSLMVSTGAVVRKGQPLACVGNSGHTSEPHLHIHAVADTDTARILKGNGIPIYFDGKFLVRNDRVKQ